MNTSMYFQKINSKLCTSKDYDLLDHLGTNLVKSSKYVVILEEVLLLLALLDLGREPTSLELKSNPRSKRDL